MNFKIFGKHVKVGEAFSKYAQTNIKELIEKYFKNPTSIIVSLSKQKKIFIINIIVHINKKMEFTANANGETAKLALNDGMEKISKQLRRYKRKISSHKIKDEKISFNSLNAQFQIIDHFSNSINEEIKEPLIFAELDTEIEELSVFEAVQKMEYGNITALMFRNKNHSGLNMIYKRSDGLIGWVDPRGERSTASLK